MVRSESSCRVDAHRVFYVAKVLAVLTPIVYSFVGPILHQRLIKRYKINTSLGKNETNTFKQETKFFLIVVHLLSPDVS
jgi:hypothetical protein